MSVLSSFVILIIINRHIFDFIPISIQLNHLKLNQSVMYIRIEIIKLKQHKEL